MWEGKREKLEHRNDLSTFKNAFVKNKSNQKVVVVFFGQLFNKCERSSCRALFW